MKAEKALASGAHPTQVVSANPKVVYAKVCMHAWASQACLRLTGETEERVVQAQWAGEAPH